MNKQKSKRDDKDTEGNTERNLFGKAVETVIVFFLCCVLIRRGVSYIVAVRVPLIIIALAVGAIFVACRIWKWRNEHGDY